jgi:Flp pilus assembly protein TadG
MDQKFSHVKKEKGQSLVELAISFLLLLLILGGIFDLGSMFYTYLALRDTAQEGVIYGSYNPIDETGITNRIHASALWPIAAAQISDINIHCCSAATTGACTSGTCTTTSATSCQGQKITVQVIYNYKLIMPVIGSLTGWQAIPLNASVTNTILESDLTRSALMKMTPPPTQFCP